MYHHRKNEDTTFLLEGADSTQIFVQKWHSLRKQNTGNVLLIVHGLGEHSGRYRHVPEYLARYFDVFYAMDLRGHGRSQGIRGHADQFDLFCGDFEKVLTEVRILEASKKNVIVLAHSFGALVVLRALFSKTFSQKKPLFDGLMLSAPCLDLAQPVSKSKLILGRVLQQTLSKLQLSQEINPSHLSHDPKIVSEYLSDRLIHQKITPQLFFEMEKNMQWVRESAEAHLKIPSLFLIPQADLIVNAKSATSFYHKLKSRSKTLIEYSGFYHEILNEIGKEKVFLDMGRWMEKHFLVRKLSAVDELQNAR